MRRRSHYVSSWRITRGKKTGNIFEYDDDGKPYIERHAHTANKPTYTAIADANAEP